MNIWLWQTRHGTDSEDRSKLELVREFVFEHDTDYPYAAAVEGYKLLDFDPGWPGLDEWVSMGELDGEDHWVFNNWPVVSSVRKVEKLGA